MYDPKSYNVLVYYFKDHSPDEGKAVIDEVKRALTSTGEITLGAPAFPPSKEKPAPGGSEDQQRIRGLIERGSDPASDAREAAANGRFGLVVATGVYSQGSPIGIACFTPFGWPPSSSGSVGVTDSPGPETSRALAYATAYNWAMVDLPTYPDADVCRRERQADRKARPDDVLVARPARPVSGPVRTLHEAARRGGYREALRLLTPETLNAVDGVGMTPLAWAVARRNRPVAELMIKSGADPWIGGRANLNEGAVFWSARLGDAVAFERLRRLPARPFKAWPRNYVDAATWGGPTILETLLAEPHERAPGAGLDFTRAPSPALELRLRDDRRLAPLLMNEATRTAPSLERVRLALRHGADPNVIERASSESPLGRVASGVYPDSLAIADLLLKAGADPNRLSERELPIWIAVGSMHLTGEEGALTDRARAIFRRLKSAGADINLPNGEGVPPSRALFFPYWGRRDTLDSSFVTPALVEFLAANGLDLNAGWEGRRVLGLVEAQAGRNSPLARTLRRLGAKR